MDERRGYSRVKFDTRATLSKGQMQATGQVSDLSLRGAYVVCDSPFEMGDGVEVRIGLYAGGDEMHLEVDANIVRQGDDGVGLQFVLEGIDLDSLTYLRHIVAYALGDPDKPMQEFAAYLEQRNS